MSMQCLLINEHQFGAIIGYSGALRDENVKAAESQFIDGKHKYADTPVLLVHGQQDEGSNPSRTDTMNWRYRYFSGKELHGI